LEESESYSEQGSKDDKLFRSAGISKSATSRDKIITRKKASRLKGKHDKSNPIDVDTS
jgi:hypothetical protein